MIFKQAHGVVILESDEIDLKITPDRDVWVRYKVKKKNEDGTASYIKPQNFRGIDRKVERGMTVLDKRIFLMRLRSKVLSSMGYKEQEEIEDD